MNRRKVRKAKLDVKVIEHQAQYLADLTKLDTMAVQSADGIVRYQRANWPLAGKPLVSVAATRLNDKEAA